jgi:hypothetical protein
MTETSKSKRKVVGKRWRQLSWFKVIKNKSVEFGKVDPIFLYYITNVACNEFRQD